MASPSRPDQWRNPVTIRTIAARVGVHPSTVSRALHGSANPDNARTRRIREVAEDLGYIPHPGAASLRTRRTLALGVTVSRLTDVVMATLYEAIERSARDLGYQALVSSTNDDVAEQRRLIDFMLARRVDGLIVADAHSDGRHVGWLQERGVPFVLAIRYAGEHPSVTADEYLGGRLAGDHLADLGHRRVAVLAGLPWSSAFSGRTAGCLAALRERAVGVPDELVVRGEVDAVGGWVQMNRLLEHDPGITAVFAVNDDAALGAGGALREHGRQPGADVAVVGYNDVPTAAAADLTTVRNPLQDIGAIATRMLIDQMAGQETHSVRLAPELVVRGTTMAAAGS
jgi:LacI family transcriptional regulator